MGRFSVSSKQTPTCNKVLLNQARIVISAMNSFPLINISGNALQRGQQHGEHLKNEICKSIEFYRSIFNLPEEEIFRLAQKFERLIEALNPDYCDEIRGIAEAANIDQAWIFALNSRTEILSYTQFVSQECTSVYFQENSLLGQTWDWGRALEPLTVLMNIVQENGHIISMITEPGIIGKIGMNSSGIGVCLNILTLGEVLDGLPVHIVLRAILDCQTMDAVNSLLDRHGNGKASNLIVANASGVGFDVEFCGDRLHRLKPENGSLLHTNHYLAENINSPEDEYFASSFARLRTANQFLDPQGSRDLQTLCQLLSDDSDAELPIYRDYRADPSVHELGTVCSIVMDLPAKRMLVRKGKSADSEFLEYQMTETGLVMA